MVKYSVIYGYKYGKLFKLNMSKKMVKYSVIHGYKYGKIFSKT